MIYNWENAGAFRIETHTNCPSCKSFLKYIGDAYHNYDNFVQRSHLLHDCVNQCKTCKGRGLVDTGDGYGCQTCLGRGYVEP